jgi:hypothetical protein
MSLPITREDSLIELKNNDESHKQLKETPSEQFDSFLIESIDEALSLLGKPVKNELYLQLEVKFNIEKNEIPQRLEEFAYILHKVFGLGASRLEVKFLRNLDSKILSDSKCINPDWSVSMWIEKEMSFLKSIKNKQKEFLLKIK